MLSAKGHMCRIRNSWVILSAVSCTWFTWITFFWALVILSMIWMKHCQFTLSLHILDMSLLLAWFPNWSLFYLVLPLILSLPHRLNSYPTVRLACGVWLLFICALLTLYRFIHLLAFKTVGLWRSGCFHFEQRPLFMRRMSYYSVINACYVSRMLMIVFCYICFSAIFHKSIPFYMPCEV